MPIDKSMAAASTFTNVKFQANQVALRKYYEISVVHLLKRPVIVIKLINYKLHSYGKVKSYVKLNVKIYVKIKNFKS